MLIAGPHALPSWSRSSIAALDNTRAGGPSGGGGWHKGATPSAHSASQRGRGHARPLVWHTALPTATDLRDKVVAVCIRTFTCINWLRTLPYLRAWHTTQLQGPRARRCAPPSSARRHERPTCLWCRVITWVWTKRVLCIDNDYAVWDAFLNQYWRRLRLAHVEGHLRHHHFGEGGYDRSENMLSGSS